MTDTAPAGPSGPGFRDLALRPELQTSLARLGYETPTPIQQSAIPALLEGQDVLGQARTGTGKTAAFSLPLLHRLDPEARGVQAIVLAPTRELAIQVAKSIHDYGREMNVRVLAVYGGQPIHVQLKALRRGVQVVVGTPGRVKDHLERKTLDLSGVRFFGLDEADEMLKMGFIEDVEWILDHAPETRQVAVFSATLPPRIRSIAERYQRDPVDVSVARKALAVPAIEQRCLKVRGVTDKDEAVERILRSEPDESVLVFAATRQACQDLTERLGSRGHDVECVHGGINQKQREAVVRRLRAKRTRVVIATDVAARGLDIDHIGLVINYDLPRDPEVYVHRIGRTGRAGRSGRSISLFRPRERRQLHRIERLAGKPMQPLPLPTDRDLAAQRRAKLQDELRRLATSEELDPGFEKLVDELVAEGLDPRRVAAAAARLNWGEAPLEPPAPAKRERRERRERTDRPDRRERSDDRRDRRERNDDRRDRRERKPRVSHDPGPLSGEEVELVLPLGKQSRLRPGDVVGAIANETGLPGKVVGAIRILDTVTFVGVAAEHAEAILAALTGVHLRNRQLQPRLAHPDGKKARRPRSSHEDRRRKRPAPSPR